MFKVGDRVQTTRALLGTASDTKGLKATVLWVNLDNKVYQIELDEPRRGRRNWYAAIDALAPLPPRPPSAAADISLKPQTKTILSHLKKRGSISPLEAWGTYSIMRLAAAIHDIRKAGYDVVTNINRDAAGHSYARYNLKGEVH